MALLPTLSNLTVNNSPTTRVFLLKMIILGCFGGTTILVLNVKIMLNWGVVSIIFYFHPETWGR